MRVVKSDLTAETFALPGAWENYAIPIQHELQSILNKKLSIKTFTSIETLFNFMIKNAPNTKNIPMINIKNTRETYIDDINGSIIWIRKTFNLGDAMTKSTDNNEISANNG